MAGARMQEMRLDILANNAANINTIGFKEDRIFRIPESIQNVWEKPDGSTLDGMTLNSLSVLPISTYTNYDQGSLNQTGNVLDLALDGEGFFSVQTSDGVKYTRKGNFTLNEDGVLTTQDGLPVMGKSGEIRIEGNHVEVDSDGAIIVDGSTVDTLAIINFSQKNQLIKTGDSLLMPSSPDVQEIPANATSVRQGFVEASNVDAIKVMTEMVDTMRGYESYQKVISSMNEITTKTVNEVGKLS
ncbi:MAG: flagellar basal-body rod protein FlgF [Desulfatirhabdiaceae bacterium]